MTTATVRVRIPDGRWIAAVSRSYPDAVFRLLAGLRTDADVVQLGTVEAEDPGAVIETVRSHPAIDAFEELARGDETAVARYRTRENGLYEVIEGSALVPQYPLVISDGWVTVDLTGTREQLREFRSTLSAAGTDVEVRSLVEAPGETGLLTDRQREVLAVAVRRGYFEVPKGCTLADVADALDIDKSTASGILRRAEGRVLEWYLTDLDGAWDR